MSQVQSLVEGASLKSCGDRAFSPCLFEPTMCGCVSASECLSQFILQQMGNDDEAKPNGDAVEPEEPEEEPELVAERLWGQVRFP